MCTKEELKKRKKLSLIDKIFFEIFFTCLILFVFVLFDKVNPNLFTKTKNKLEENVNFLKVASFITSDIYKKEFDDFVFNPLNYDFYNYDDATFQNSFSSFSSDLIYCADFGIVSKLTKNKDQTFDIFITTVNGFEVGYLGVKNHNLTIYDYVEKDEIIATSCYDEKDQSFNFKMTIKKNGEYYSYEDFCEN